MIIITSVIEMIIIVITNLNYDILIKFQITLQSNFQNLVNNFLRKSLELKGFLILVYKDPVSAIYLN